MLMAIKVHMVRFHKSGILDLQIVKSKILKQLLSKVPYNLHFENPKSRFVWQ